MPEIIETGLLTKDEMADINECAAYHKLKTSPAWLKLKEHMDSLVHEALRDMRMCLSSDKDLRSNLQIRWQQRDAMAAALTSLVDVKSAEYLSWLDQLQKLKTEEESWQPQL